MLLKRLQLCSGIVIFGIRMQSSILIVLEHRVRASLYMKDMGSVFLTCVSMSTVVISVMKSVGSMVRWLSNLQLHCFSLVWEKFLF